MKILKGKLNKSVVTLGKFDCLHQGHKKLISEAKKISESLGIPLVAYTFSNVLREKVFSFEQRLKIFEKLGCDYVYVEEFSDQFKNLSPEEFFANKLIANLGAVHIVAGTDWKFGKDRVGDIDTLKNLCLEYDKGISVVEKLELYGEEVSSTAIKTYLRKGDIKRVNEYLGREYYIRGNVTQGKKLGRKLGFPTANITLSEEFVYPQDGVYATKTILGDEEYLSVTNVGTNPTVNDIIKRAETHIIDFEGNLYGENITILFLTRIRGEIKFPDIESLKNQVKDDIMYTKNFYGDYRYTPDSKKDIMSIPRELVSRIDKTAKAKSFHLFFCGDDPKMNTLKIQHHTQNDYLLCDSGNFDDYICAINTVKKIINPDEIYYYGGEDITGYFIKDGVRVDVVRDGTWEFNLMIIRTDKYPSHIVEIAEKWIVLVNNELRNMTENNN